MFRTILQHADQTRSRDLATYLLLCAGALTPFVGMAYFGSEIARGEAALEGTEVAIHAAAPSAKRPVLCCAAVTVR